MDAAWGAASGVYIQDLPQGCVLGNCSLWSWACTWGDLWRYRILDNDRINFLDSTFLFYQIHCVAFEVYTERIMKT